MKFTQMLIPVCFFIIFMQHVQAVEVTLVQSAVSTEAYCLDGTLPAYQLDQGFGTGVDSWLVYLEGGAWCNSPWACQMRQNSSLGSSTNMSAYPFVGILSNTETENPDFYNWNRVLIRYCDGSSFMGNVSKPDPVTNNHYRGAFIFNAVVEELLMAKGMRYANNAILSGCSAGGLAAIYHCDGFRAMIPNAKRVKCISDAGFFIRGKDLANPIRREGNFGAVVETHGMNKTLPASCTSRMDPRLCFFPENLVQDIKTPLFLLNSAADKWQIQFDLQPPPGTESDWENCTHNLALCTDNQLQLMRDFSSAFLTALRGTGNSASRGMFISSCYTHCLTYGATWNGFLYTSEKKTLATAIGDWYFDRGSLQEIDYNTTPRNCSLPVDMSSLFEGH